MSRWRSARRADVAQAASDIVLTGSLDALAEARALARRMLAILRQNRRWALAYNLAAVPLAALGFVPPWLAALGHVRELDRGGAQCAAHRAATSAATRAATRRRNPSRFSAGRPHDEPRVPDSAVDR